MLIVYEGEERKARDILATVTDTLRHAVIADVVKAFNRAAEEVKVLAPGEKRVITTTPLSIEISRSEEQSDDASIKVRAEFED